MARASYSVDIEDGGSNNVPSGSVTNNRRDRTSWPTRPSSRSQFWPRHHHHRHNVGRVPTPEGAQNVVPPQSRHHHHHHPQQHPQQPPPSQQPRQHSPPLQSLNFQPPSSGPLLYRAFPQLAGPIGAMAVFAGAPAPADHQIHHRNDHHSHERADWSRVHPDTEGLGPGGGTVDPDEYVYEHETYGHNGVGGGGVSEMPGSPVSEGAAAPEEVPSPASPSDTPPTNTDTTAEEVIDEMIANFDGADHDAEQGIVGGNDEKPQTIVEEEGSPQLSSVDAPHFSSVVAVQSCVNPKAVSAEVKPSNEHVDTKDEDDVVDWDNEATDGSNEKQVPDNTGKNEVDPDEGKMAQQNNEKFPDEVVCVDDEEDESGAIMVGVVPPPRSAAATPDTVGGESAVSALTTPSLEAENDDNEAHQEPRKYSPRLPPSYNNYRPGPEFAAHQQFYSHGAAGQHPSMILEHQQQQMPMYGQGMVYAYNDQAHAAQAHAAQALHLHQQHQYYTNVDPNTGAVLNQPVKSEGEAVDATIENKARDNVLEGGDKEKDSDFQDVSISSCSDVSGDDSENQVNDEDSFDEDDDEEEEPPPMRLTMNLENSGGACRIASPDSKYESYACRVDPNQSDRSTEIFLFSAARPHMRGFHFAWIGFFIAMATWFAIAPLLTEVQRSLDLTKEQIWTSSIWGSAGTVIFRFTNGPLCDKYGARWIMGLTLIFSGVPTMLTGVVQTSSGLSLIRAFIGIAGSSFVMCQYWTATMFTREVSGTALSLAAGWGNLGGAVTNVVMGSLLFPLFRLIYGGKSAAPQSSDKAWRTACIIPGIISVLWGLITIKYSDDCPKGNYRKRKRMGLMSSVSVWSSMLAASKKPNTWLMFVQYSCCFGVEVTMTNAAALYFSSEFGLSTASAAAVASIFGWMNLFARGLGGFCSDMANVSYGMKGRLTVQMIFLFLEGAMVVVFGYSPSLGGSIVSMIFFSLFVQTSEGSSYAIVPYIKPAATGSVSGIIGAGGALGGVLFPILFQNLSYRNAFRIMGWCALASSFLTPFIVIKGHDPMFSRWRSNNSQDDKKLEDKTSAHASAKNPIDTLDTEGEEKQAEGHLSPPDSIVSNGQAEVNCASNIADSFRDEDDRIKGDAIPTR